MSTTPKFGDDLAVDTLRLVASDLLEHWLVAGLALTELYANKGKADQ